MGLGTTRTFSFFGTGETTWKKKEALARWHGIKQCDGDFTALDPDVDCDFKT